MTKKMSKKEQFSKTRSTKLPLVIAIIAIFAVGALATGLLAGKPEAADETRYSGEAEAESRSYIGRVVPMAAVEPTIEGNWVSIPLQLLEDKDIVYFEVENNQDFMVPLMAYITPSGRIFTGSSMCEPCRGRYFSLAGETLVCDTCRTTYTIEEREFISGSQDCGSYPPVSMSHIVEDGLVRIVLQEILDWRIRAY